MYYLVQLRLRRAPPAPKANQNIDGADTQSSDPERCGEQGREAGSAIAGLAVEA